MLERFSQFPRSLAERVRSTNFGGVPVLLAHPDWAHPAPTVLWMHGRTAHKEIDAGRFLRWIRAGIAACSIDLPGHGERATPTGHLAERTPEMLAQMIGEIDGVVSALSSTEFGGVFDVERLGIGGMSAGGMAALRRLCDPHPFTCCAVEGTTGWLEGLFAARGAMEGHRPHDPAAVRRVDATAHLEGFRPMPVLMLHSEADELVPFETAREFAARLGRAFALRGADPGLVRLVSWPTTGAPFEHNGFGNVANEAKTTQTTFLAECLGARAPGEG